jgi:hypothetical protein
MSIKKHISNSAFYLCDGFKNLSLELNLKMWTKFGVQNHILANYNSLEPDFYQLISNIEGYRVHDIIELKPIELFNQPINFILPPMLHPQEYALSLTVWRGRKRMTAHLVKLNAIKDTCDSQNKPKSLSLICVHGDPLFAYQGIYRGNRLSPRMVITSWDGWGWPEYEEFRKTNNSLEWMVSKTMIQEKSYVASTANLEWSNLRIEPSPFLEKYPTLNLYKVV